MKELNFDWLLNGSCLLSDVAWHISQLVFIPARQANGCATR